MLISPKAAFAPAAAPAAAADDLSFVAEESSFAELLTRDADLSNVDLVIAPLVGADFDAVELILLLGEAGFRGRLHVRSTALPNRQLVLGELRSVAGAFGFRVDLACAA